MLARVAAASSTVGLAMALIGLVAYEMPLSMVAMLFVSSAAGGVMMVAAAKFQSEHRFGISLTLMQSPTLSSFWPRSPESGCMRPGPGSRC